jgi:hypothetical protein
MLGNYNKKSKLDKRGSPLESAENVEHSKYVTNNVNEVTLLGRREGWG